MSANFPPSATEKSADASLRSGAAASNNVEAGKNAARSTQSSVRNELANLKEELETLLLRASDTSERELRDAHATALTKFQSIQASTKHIAAEANHQLHKTGEYVKEHPMPFVAIAAGLGLAIGMFASKR